jgi:hypothetical protein
MCRQARTANRPEHIAADDPGADIFEAARHEVVIDPGCASIASVHPLKSSGLESPLVEDEAAGAEGISKVLMGAGAVAVEGDGEVMHAQFGHGRCDNINVYAKSLRHLRQGAAIRE